MSYGSSITLAKLYERTSANGNTYYAGRLGGANVVLLATDETSNSGQPIWVLKVSEGQKKEGYQPRERGRKIGSEEFGNGSVYDTRQNEPEFNDAIPF